MEKKFSDEQIKKAFSAHPDNVKAASVSIGMSDAGFHYRARKLGLIEAGKPRAKQGKGGKSKKGGLGPAAAEPLTPEAKAADTQPPPVQPASPSRSTSMALAPVPASAPMGSDSVLDQVEGVISAAQQIVAALRPLGDAARHQVLMLVGGAGVGLPARGEG